MKWQGRTILVTWSLENRKLPVLALYQYDTASEYNINMLIDDVEITVTAGHGGPGKASFFKKGRGPDGGNGGKGGDVYFEATSDLMALNVYSGKKNFTAQSGEPGGSNKKAGHNASDMILKAPIGTEIIDLDSKEIFTLTQSNQRILICRGGIGGLGNADRANARMTTPKYAQHGIPGQQRRLHLILKLIADFGLIGLPNAGKSSLLNELTNANAKVASYQFTTLEPNLGVCQGRVIADIPGLIEGASAGKGLGIKFLQHIEKIPVLLHCIASDSDDPKRDYKIIREELKKYNPELLNKKEIILRTKADICKPTKLKGLAVSILDDKSIEEVKKLLV